MKDGFTEIDERQANAMGWSLDFIYDSQGYFTYCIVPSINSSLKSGYEARQFVWSAAKQGDVLCRKALSLVASTELAGKGKKTTSKKGARR